MKEAIEKIDEFAFNLRDIIEKKRFRIPMNQVADQISMNYSTFRHRLDNPGTWRINELKKLIRFLDSY